MNTLNTAVVAGASGCIGQQLVRHLQASTITVRTIGRGPAADALWSDEEALAAVLSGTDLLVNLAGRSVSCGYTRRTADEIFASRVGTTATLGRILARIEDPPALWVNASTGTIYRDARDHSQDERTRGARLGFLRGRGPGVGARAVQCPGTGWAGPGSARSPVPTPRRPAPVGPRHCDPRRFAPRPRPRPPPNPAPARPGVALRRALWTDCSGTPRSPPAGRSRPRARTRRRRRRPA